MGQCKPNGVSMMKQEWFDMNDIRRKNFSRSVWIPLRAFDNTESEGKYGYLGYKEELFGCGTIAVPSSKIELAKNLDWSDIGINEHSSYVEDDEYVSADSHKIYGEDYIGLRLVIDQRSFDDKPPIWHLNQDFVIALGLVRENNVWVCPQDGYAEVARLKVDNEGEPLLLEVKAQYLKDYLCARNMCLYMTMFFRRDAIYEDMSFLAWPNGNNKYENDSYLWEGRFMEIHEGGHPFDTQMSVMHVARTDVDESDDVPDLSAIPNDENIKSKSWVTRFEGKKLYRVMGELWRTEVIEPAKFSPKVRKDDVTSTVFFTINAEGTKVCGKQLIDSGKWLWFKPDVIMSLYHRRGGILAFYTSQTGCVGASNGYGVHFGVNKLGLICVFAKDIGLLPEWQQQIWAGFNITPEGGVSEELLASQVRATPAETQAPEPFLAHVFQQLNELSEDKLGIKIFREHAIIPDLIKKTHRFRSIDEASFYSLSKDLARLIVDSLDAEAMQTIVPPPKKTKWGSLKSLENLLASKYNVDFVRKTTASLVGVYELRHADAHLPSSKIEEAFDLIKIDKSIPYVHQGYEMLYQVVSSLYEILECLKMWPTTE